MILRVGLTGGIASGKSTVAGLLGRLGCQVIDADEVVRDLYRPGGEGHRRVVEVYGTEVLTAEGTIDRGRLATLALADPSQAARINALIHPLVADEVERRFAAIESAASEAIAVVEATLLVEAGTGSRYHRVVVVDADPETQLRRGEARGMDRPEVERRMARQMDRAGRLRHADYVLTNDGDREALAAAVEILFARLQEDLSLLRAGRLPRKEATGSGIS